jgi:hypothetical protein
VRNLVLSLSALLVLAAGLPANANILDEQKLESVIRSSTQLSMKLISGRQYVSVQGRGDALGYLDASMLDYGYQIDRTDVLMVPLVSGGSGGVFSTLIFSTKNGRPYLAGDIDSNGHLDVHLSQGLILAVTPTYGPHDPMARPSGHRTVRYAIHDGKLVKLDEYTSGQR